MNGKKIYIQFWNADTDEWEWREFSTDEVDELMQLEIIDCDSLGYAMGVDQDAFEAALLHMTELNRAFSYKDFVDYYLSITDKEIRINA